LEKYLKKSKLWTNYFFKLNRTLNGCHLHPYFASFDIDNLIFIHGGIGIVINGSAKFGKNVKIY